MRILGWAEGVLEYTLAASTYITTRPAAGISKITGIPIDNTAIDWANETFAGGNTAIWEGLKGLAFLASLPENPESRQEFALSVARSVAELVKEEGGFEEAYDVGVGMLIPNILLCFIPLGGATKAARTTEVTMQTTETLRTAKAIEETMVVGETVADGTRAAAEAGHMRSLRMLEYRLRYFG
jgi:hypothetical protein